MIEKKTLIDYRGLTSKDLPFIYSSWTRSFRYGNKPFTYSDKQFFFAWMKQTIDWILTDPDTKLKVACLKESPEIILGYSASKDDLLYWVFVKSSWRNIGLAKELMPKPIRKIFFSTKDSLEIIKNKMPALYRELKHAYDKKG